MTAEQAALPAPRGALSALLTVTLRGPERPLPEHPLPAHRDREDAALALWVLHELHYRGFDGVDERWEWSPSLIDLRRGLEEAFEGELRRRWESARAAPERSDDADVVTALQRLVAAHDGPSVARHVQRHATRDQVLAMLRQKALYHHKEADPTSWVVPRLSGGPKAALLEVQFDEYGDGDPARLHHDLFARGMVASGLNAGYGGYVDETSTEVLEQNNAVSMFGLHRRLRGAALGHLAAFESTSSLPSRQLAQGLTRLGFPPEMVAYYDEHVEADAVHEQVVLRDVCGALVAEEPALRDDVLLGAFTCLDLETRAAGVLLASWEAA